jgi:hypothetical protein
MQYPNDTNKIVRYVINELGNNSHQGMIRYRFFTCLFKKARAVVC